MSNPSWKRRVDNTIWAGAKSYEFKPLFYMKDLSGEIDPYMNLIEGLAVKYFSAEEMADLFHLWEQQVRQYRFDQMAWIALERYLSQKEMPHRPALPRLQENYAKMILRPENELRLRISYLKDALSGRLLHARAQEILGKPLSLNAKETKIYNQLKLPEDCTAEDIKNTLLPLYKKLGFRPGHKRRSHPFLNRLGSLTPRQLEYSNRPENFYSENEGAKKQSRLFRFFLARRRAKEEEKVRLFGPSLLSEKERIKWEEKNCKGPHKGLKLWLTRGPEEDPTGEFRREQLRNQRAYQEKELIYNQAIDSLSSKIASVLQAQTGQEVSINRHGRLIGKRAWRSLLGSDRIFERSINQPVAGFSVDLFLDASASRGPNQEEIAAQSIIVSRAMDKVGIPNRVLSFYSFQDHTVFTLLKDFNETSQEALFSYVARGWNRDGLAYRALADLIDKRPSDRHLLLIFSDVCPRDLRPMSGFPHYDYAGEKAVKDSLESIKLLRRKDIAIAGLVSGVLADTDQARQFFGSHFARIRRPEELASGAGRILQNEIERLSYN